MAHPFTQLVTISVIFLQEIEPEHNPTTAASDANLTKNRYRNIAACK